MHGKKWTVEDIKKFAMEHYNDGLDGIIECYDDKMIEQLLVEENYHPEKRLQMMMDIEQDWNEARKWMSGEPEEGWNSGYTLEEVLEEERKKSEPYEEEYCPSATRGDYSPSNPWDAPGMSISDFI